MKCTYFSVLVALQLGTSFTLQLISPPPDQNVGLYEAPASYRQPGKPQLNTIIIKSKPFTSNDTRVLNSTTKWRRNLYIETESDETDDIKSEQNEPSICVDQDSCSESPPPTFKPYSQEELNKFLNKYAELHGKPPSEDSDTEEEPSNKLANLYMENENVNVLATTPKTTEKDKSKSASWQLVQSQVHNHPYDDHKGWVTLEPIPWSSSQIQKWEPNPNSRPQIPSWDYKPDQHHQSPQYDYKPQHFSTERPWNKPTYEYKPQRPSYNQHWAQNSKPHWHQNEEHAPSHWGGNPDIITDDRPGSHFPVDNHGHRPPWHEQDEYSSSNRPNQGFYNYPEQPSRRPSGPNDGDGSGRWVLLSSTKGYSAPPKRHGYQRSMTFDTQVPNSMSSHRSVRLTVLPALANTTNTTTSHGGLLEVESTFQTVDEAQREHAARMMKLEAKQKNETTVKPKSLHKDNVKRSDVRVLTTRNTNNKAAIIAAVGAGMIPATVAMLLPVMLGRRRRNTETSDEDVTQKANSTKRIIHKQKLLFSGS